MSVLARLDDLRAACTSRREVARGVFQRLLHEDFFSITPDTIEAMVAAASFHPYAYMHAVGECAPDHLVRTSDQEMNAWAEVYSALKTRVREDDYATYCAKLRPTVVDLMDTIALTREQLGNPFTRYYDEERPLSTSCVISILQQDIEVRRTVARHHRYQPRATDFTSVVANLLAQPRWWQEYAHQEIRAYLHAMLVLEHEQWRALKHAPTRSTEHLEAVLAMQAEALTNPLVRHYEKAVGRLVATGSG